MATIWSGSLRVDEEIVLEGMIFVTPSIVLISSLTQAGITLTSNVNDDSSVDALPNVSLRYLSIVETDRVPLHLSVGRPWTLEAKVKQTETYFTSILCPRQATEDGIGSVASWWEDARLDSPLGVLVACESSIVRPVTTGGPRITELLFYASKSTNATRRTSPHVGEQHESGAHSFQVNVLPLSSDLVRRNGGSRLTPPLSPTHDNQQVPTFLPRVSSASCDVDPIHNPPTRKRKSVNDTLDEAAERRRKIRKHGGEGVATAAAPQAISDALPSLRHRRTVSGQSAAPASRPLSRASSIASNGQPANARDHTVSNASKPSNLSRVKSITALPETDGAVNIEIKNKELVSRTVMAGMRLYGFSQSKNRKVKMEYSSSGIRPELSEEERLQDEEYKLLYHQVYKATCFAFRAHITLGSLFGDAEALRECVDKLLAIFCSDPLLSVVESPDDKLTPGGRKLFGSASAGVVASQEESYFPGIG